jgi:3D (Asp-Asp-Asp) domain-containing protein
MQQRRLLLLIAALLAACALTPQVARAGWWHSNPADGHYIATAYDQTGATASGLYTKRHVVAADPDILPLGTIIRIRHAGRYSGEYVVADTGAKIEGRRLDIYIPSLAACKKFGVRRVSVRVIRLGENTDHSAKVAYNQVKQHVAAEIANNNPAPVAATPEEIGAASASRSQRAVNAASQTSNNSSLAATPQ